MQRTVRKMDAAGALLNRALEVYLKDEDCISAIVLGGSAEDILQGLLKLQGREGEAARAQMVAGAIQIAQTFQPLGETASEKDTIKLMRGMFNWLRHSDSKDDIDPVTWDLELEAEIVLSRALQNWDLLRGPDPSHAAEFVEALTARPQSSSVVNVTQSG